MPSREPLASGSERVRAPVTEPVALIGYGAIGRVVAAEVPVAAVLVRPGRAQAAEAALPEAAAVESVEDLDRIGPGVMVECAGQGAVAEYGEAVLARGMDLMVISTGAFADEALFDRLCETAARAGSRILVPAGATTGLDGLLALQAGGLDSVLYVSSKPPRSWLGTPAEEVCDLTSLTEPTVIYSGPAADAARLFPKNANLAVTVALAGLGLHETRVELVADPNLTGNVGQITAAGRLGEMNVTMANRAMPDNPKTSMVTAYSIIAALRSGNVAMTFP